MIPPFAICGVILTAILFVVIIIAAVYFFSGQASIDLLHDCEEERY